MHANASPTACLRFFAVPLLCLGWIVMTGAARAQDPAPAPVTAAPASAPNTPTLTPSPMAQLKSLEPPSDEEYQLGGGDELTLEFAGRPEISGKHVVGPDGRITLPSGGRGPGRRG